MNYRKLTELPRYLAEHQIESSLHDAMNEHEIAAYIESLETIGDTIDMTGMKLDDQNVGHNVIAQSVLFNEHAVTIVFEATYEEYDDDYDTWQYIYTRPIGWQSSCMH